MSKQFQRLNKTDSQPAAVTFLVPVLVSGRKYKLRDTMTREEWEGLPEKNRTAMLRNGYPSSCINFHADRQERA